MPAGYVVFAGARAGEACAGTALPAVQEDEGAGVAGLGLAARQGPHERQHDGDGPGQDQDQGVGRRDRRTYAAAATASARGESSATTRARDGATRYTEFFGNANGGSASSPAVDAVRSGTGGAGRALSRAAGSDDDGSETIFTASGEESAPSEGLLQSVSLASSRVSAHPLDLGRFDSGFDWEFQRLMEVVTRDQTVLRESETFQQLTALVQDFRHAAMVYGKVIISEKHLAVERKTIKPVEVGGYAGGEKYVAGNVFFRFPNDMHGFYGGSIESASKEANHQIKGLTALFNASVPGLYLPLLCVIKHRGYKLVAMSVLPIRGQETLCYGSSDGGMNIGCLGEDGGSTDAGEGDENAAKLMEGAARALNLAKHPVMARARTSRGARPTPVWLHMPCDMEVHRCNVGNTSRYYAVDFARLFPAQPPSGQLESIIADAYGDEPFAHKVTSSNHLVHRLRPELVRAWHAPLSSDAFSNFSSRTEREDTFDRDAASAVKHMFAVSMGSLIKDLNANRETHEASAVQRAVSRRVVEAFHRNGVNMRFLGVVSARSAGKPELQRELMLEAVARVVKLLVRGAQRGVCSDVRTAVITPYLNAVREVLNQIFGITTCTRNDVPADSAGGGDCGMSKEIGACSCGSFVEPARQSFRDMGHAMRLGRLPRLGSSNSEGDTEGVEDDEELVGRRNFWCKRLPLLLQERFFFLLEGDRGVRTTLMGIDSSLFDREAGQESRCVCCNCLWKRCINPAELFARVQVMCGIVLTSSCQEAVSSALEIPRGRVGIPKVRHTVSSSRKSSSSNAKSHDSTCSSAIGARQTSIGSGGGSGVWDSLTVSTSMASEASTLSSQSTGSSLSSTMSTSLLRRTDVDPSVANGKRTHHSQPTSVSLASSASGVPYSSPGPQGAKAGKWDAGPPPSLFKARAAAAAATAEAAVAATSPVTPHKQRSESRPNYEQQQQQREQQQNGDQRQASPSLVASVLSTSSRSPAFMASPLPLHHEMRLGELTSSGRNCFDWLEPFEGNDLVEVEGSIHLLPIMQYAEGTELFIRSRSKLGQGKRKEAHRLARLALKRFSAGLSMNPSDVRLLCNRGFLINYFHDTFGEGERGAGNSDFLLALRANPQHARSWYYLGKELYSYWINDGYNVKPSIESQVSALRAALPIDDDSLESMESLFAGTKIREERSRALLQYVDYCLKQALRADPGLTNCVKDYANFRYHTLVDLDGAEALYLRALDLDPEHGRTLQNLARLYRKRGDLDKAATTIARNLDVDPENPLIFLELADTVLQSLAKGRQSTFPAHVTFAKAKLPYPSSLGKGSMNLDRKMLKRLQPGLATGFRASAGDIIPVLTRANDLVRDAIALIRRRINDDHLRGHSRGRAFESTDPDVHATLSFRASKTLLRISQTSFSCVVSLLRQNASWIDYLREVWTGFEWSIRIIEADAFYMEHQNGTGEGSETQTLVKLRRQKSAAHTAYARSLVWSVDDSVHFRFEWNDVELRAVVKTATRKLRESAQTLRMEADLSNEVVYTLELAQKQLLQACEFEPRSRSAARMSLASLWLIFHKVEDDELLAAMDEERSKTPRNDRASKSDVLSKPSERGRSPSSTTSNQSNRSNRSGRHTGTLNRGETSNRHGVDLGRGGQSAEQGPPKENDRSRRNNTRFEHRNNGGSNSGYSGSTRGNYRGSTRGNHRGSTRNNYRGASRGDYQGSSRDTFSSSRGSNRSMRGTRRGEGARGRSRGNGRR